MLHADYVDQQDGISTRSQGRVLVQNNDFIGVASYSIFIGIAVATALWVKETLDTEMYFTQDTPRR
jgi:hypothetical protein